jgi:hypothetical protein
VVNANKESTGNLYMESDQSRHAVSLALGKVDDRLRDANLAAGDYAIKENGNSRVDFRNSFDGLCHLQHMHNLKVAFV